MLDVLQSQKFCTEKRVPRGPWHRSLEPYFIVPPLQIRPVSHKFLPGVHVSSISSIYLSVHHWISSLSQTLWVFTQMMNLKPSSGTQCFPQMTCQVEVQYTQQVGPLLLLLSQNLGAWNPTSSLPFSLDVPPNKQASITPMKRGIPLPDATCFSSKLFCIQRKYNQWKNITMVIVLPWSKLYA